MMKTSLIHMTVFLAILGAFQLPAAAGTVAFTFNLNTTITGSREADGSLDFNELSNPFTGTLDPLGNSTAYFAPNGTADGVTVTFMMANGSTISSTGTLQPGAPLTFNVAGTITGGTGIFANATGTYSAFVSPPKTFTSLPSDLMVPVTITGSGTIIAPDASGGVSILPEVLKFQVPEASPSASTQTLILNNQGLDGLNFQISTSTGSKWLSVSQPSGSAPAGGTAAIPVMADPSGLQPGVYNGALTISYTGTSLDVPVFLVVGDNSAILATSDTGLYLQAEFGGSAVTQTIDVANIGVGNLAGLTSAVSLTDSESNWLQAALPSGSGSQYQEAVPITANPATLPVGVYFGQIKFTLPHSQDSPQTVAVLMEVVDDALPSVTPADAIFAGANAMPQVFTISNPTTQTVSFTVAFDPMTDPTNAGWVSFSPSSGSIPPGGTAQLTLTENISGCAAASNCVSHLVTGAHAYVDVTFPALNKTIIFGIELAPSQKFCAEGVTQACTGQTPSLRLSAPPHAAATCTPTQLVGVFTALPYGFHASVGQPQPLDVKIIDDCENTVNSGTVVATFSSAEKPVTLQSFGNGLWAATWTPHVAATSEQITLQAVSPAGTSGLLTIPGSVVAGAPLPLVASSGVVDAASGSAVISPGDFISIYGGDLAAGTTITKSAPYPPSLGNVQATLGGESLPLYFTAAGQIDAIVPFDVPVNGTQQVIVQNGNALSQPEAVTVAAAAPAVFTQNQSGTGPGAIEGQKPEAAAVLNSPSNPSSAGDALIIYCTGLGSVHPAVTAGTPASSTVLSYTDNTVTVTVGGQDAKVLFAGLAPGYVGLYQVNVTVPSGITASDAVPVVLTAGGLSSVPVTVSIH